MSLGEYAAPYGRNHELSGARPAYSRTEGGGHLIGGGTYYPTIEYHHPLAAELLGQKQAQVDFAARQSTAAAEGKALAEQGPASHVHPRHNWGSLGGTECDTPTTIEAIEARIKQKAKPQVGPYREVIGKEIFTGGGSAFRDISGIPTESAYVHHTIQAQHGGLLGHCSKGRIPYPYETLCDDVMDHRRIAPSYPGAPQAARRSGVFCDSADTLDCKAQWTQLCLAAMLQGKLSRQEATGDIRYSVEEPLMLQQLDRAGVCAARGQDDIFQRAEAQRLRQEAEAKSPGIQSRYRRVGWPAEHPRITETCGGFHDF